MCGITGILDFQRPVEAKCLDRFTDALSHRGPDGRGIHIDNNLGLGHRRLAILDPTEAGACPMPFGGADGRRYWITFNGEVFNFLELRQELWELGYRFHSDTDTEVVVAAYAHWGRDCLLRFNGMFAFGIWDSESKTLFLARDRFGVKPLLFAIQDGRFAFASELKAFVSLDGFRRQCDEEVALASLTRGQALEGTTPRTLMKDVQRLMPGHWLQVDSQGQLEIGCWWNTLEHLVEVPLLREERIDRFRELLVDAVRLRLRSDIAVGSSLSGGLDSSSIVSIMSLLGSHAPQAGTRSPADWRRAFIASFPGTALDEVEFANEVVKQTHAKARVWEFDPTAALGHLTDVVWSMEDVYPGIAVPAWALYREMRRDGVFVSLDGHGADELLGGYPWYLDTPLTELNSVLDRDFHQTLLPSILRNFDRCSMAHGVEVRTPFLDWRLVTFAASLPADEKVGGGYTKRILRDAMKGVIPHSVRTRRCKIGFNSPMIDWFNGALKPFLYDCMSHRYWEQSPWWNGPSTRNHVRAKSETKGWVLADWDDTLRVWSQANLVLWMRMFIDGETFSGGVLA
jgi:asparagine synthase (glutamine-hydrolysing)